jgi:hypothetical protein
MRCAHVLGGAKSAVPVTVAFALLIACSGGGWHSQTIVHSWQVTIPTPNPEPCPSDNDACQAFEDKVSPNVFTAVELDDGHSYRLETPSDAQPTFPPDFTPGMPVELYRGRSKSGETFYSIRLQRAPAIAWQVSPYVKPDDEATPAH